jgi:hypothetical protein
MKKETYHCTYSVQVDILTPANGLYIYSALSPRIPEEVYVLTPPYNRVARMYRRSAHEIEWIDTPVVAYNHLERQLYTDSVEYVHIIQ